MLLCQFERTARIRVLIATASRHEHGNRTGVSCFQFLLGKPCVVAAELIETQGGVVTGVSEDNSEQTSILGLHT